VAEGVPDPEAPSSEAAPSETVTVEAEQGPTVAEASADAAEEPETAPVPVAESASLAGIEPDAAETASGDAAEAGADTAADSASPEPVLVEIWRLQRHQRSSAPRQNRPRGGRDGAPAGNRAPGEGRQDRRPAHAGAPRAGGPDGAERNRGGQGDRPEGGRRDGGRPEGGRPPRRERFEPGRVRPERRDEGRPAAQQEQRPQRRERAPDPDSPFAKLAALKAQLEAGDGGKR
jgi:ATP-dependent RNA helicase SUPV3L1/SUV3